MTLNYGRPADPEAFIIAQLKKLGLPVGPERDPEVPLPCYVVTGVQNKSNRFVLCATVSVRTFALTRAEAMAAAWSADNLLLSLTPGDSVTLPDGSFANGAWVCPFMSPIYHDYQDPRVKVYIGRYTAELRFV
jgi:hypothetical protein